MRNNCYQAKKDCDARRTGDTWGESYARSSFLPDRLSRPKQQWVGLGGSCRTPWTEEIELRVWGDQHSYSSEGGVPENREMHRERTPQYVSVQAGDTVSRGWGESFLRGSERIVTGTCTGLGIVSIPTNQTRKPHTARSIDRVLNNGGWFLALDNTVLCYNPEGPKYQMIPKLTTAFPNNAEEYL